MMLSFAEQLGEGAVDLAREAASQEAIVEIYRSKLGVPGLERSTARVGNMSWKRAMRLAAVVVPDEQGSCELRFAPRDFEVLAAPEGGELEDCMWDKLVGDLKAGVRIMYHCANHYTRVFGVRESREGVPPSVLGGPVAGPGSSDDPLGNAEVLGGDSDGENDGQAASTAAPNVGEQEFLWGRHQSARGTRREILTAKRGQGAKHWVSWNQVFADIHKHGLHKLFCVTAKSRRAVPAIRREGAPSDVTSAAQAAAEPPPSLECRRQDTTTIPAAQLEAACL
jgi:hypothetical protein